MQSAATIAVLASAMLIAPPSLRGQVELSVQPRISSFVPVASVYHVDRSLGTQDDPWNREVSSTTVSRSPAFSVAIQVGDPQVGWMLRSGITRSIKSSTIVHGVLDPTGPGVPLLPPDPHLDEAFQFELPSAMTVGFAEAVLPLLLGTSTVRPYVSVGAAVKTYRFGDFDPGACESAWLSCEAMDFTLPHSGTVLGAQVGAGVIARLGGRSIEVGVADSFNDYQGRTKHDLNVFAGVAIPILR